MTHGRSSAYIREQNRDHWDFGDWVLMMSSLMVGGAFALRANGVCLSVDKQDLAENSQCLLVVRGYLSEAELSVSDNTAPTNTHAAIG